MTELQLALDFVTIAEAKAILAEVGDGIDIVEIGTPFVIQEGIRAVREIAEAFPKIKVLADLKIMDAGEHESKMAFLAGADYVTVLGAADDATIRASVAEADRHGKSIVVDMIGVADMDKRARAIDALGAHYICVHTAFDIQSTGADPLEELKVVKAAVKRAKTAVAGGIKIATLPPIAKEAPEIVIVGGGITGQADKRAAALEMKRILGR
jgi:3-hexulose-6-phosphate synthase